MADENMVMNAVQPCENGDNNDSDPNILEDDENYAEAEFEAINSRLDQLNSVLDTLEKKNDDIHAELKELLQSNLEARKQFQESQKEKETESETMEC